MSLQFDLRGNLRPYELVETNFESLPHDLVLSYGENSTRHSIFHHFEVFLDELKTILPDPLECWVDGSFVTTKENPRDIDLVLFIDYQSFNQKQDALRQLFDSFSNTQVRLVDPYPVVVYPENHRNFAFYRSDYLYWFHQFSQSKPNRAQRHFPKGIIKITI